MPTLRSSRLNDARSRVDNIIPVYGIERRITATNFLNEISSTALGGLFENGTLNAGSIRGTETV